MTSQGRTPHKRTKQLLKRLGWTQTAAAQHLGVTIEHLNRVLNGHRISATLLKQIDELPAREVSK